MSIRMITKNVTTHFLLEEETLCTRKITINKIARKATETAIATTMTITGCTLASSGVADINREKIISHSVYCCHYFLLTGFIVCDYSFSNAT